MGDFDIGKQNMQVMVALKKKYERDYLPYFRGLADLYISGKNKKALDATVQKVNRLLNLLEDVIGEGRIETADSEKLYSLVDSIEEDKVHFAEEAQQTKAFQERIDKVTAETGISSEDLNVSREIVREGVRFAHKSQQESGSFFQRHFPSTQKFGGRVAHALGASLLGPMYPAGKVLAGLAGDVRKASQRRDISREQRLGSALSASLRSHGGMEHFQEARRTGPDIAGFRIGASEARKKAGMASLREFFDKGAFKAKWTRELLDSAKEGKRKRLDFFNRLRDRIGGLNSGLAGLLGKGGAIAGIGLASVFTGSKLKELGGKLSEYGDVQTQVSAQIRKQHALQQKFMNKINAILDAKTIEAQKGTKELKGATSEIRGKMSTREQLLKAAPTTIKDPFTGEMVEVNTGEPTIVAPSAVALPPTPSGVAPSGTVQPVSPKTEAAKPKSDPSLMELNKTMRDLVSQLEKSQAVTPATTHGNPFDSGDVLLQEHANGRLTLGE
jgi:hypothetical protein